MTYWKVRQKGPSEAQIKAYGTAASRACNKLGIFSEKDKKEYRHRVVAELTGRDSIFDVRSNGDIDLIMHRFWIDAGEYFQAAKFCVNYERQMGYVVKVLAVQLMQLKGGDEQGAFDYVSGVLDQARVANGRYTDGSGFWLDVSPSRIADLLKILDTERRRILKRFGGPAGRFDDRVRYTIDGNLLTRQGVEADYYARAPFKAIVRAA